MNLTLLNSGKYYYYGFSVVFYFGYAYFAAVKFIEKSKSELENIFKAVLK